MGEELSRILIGLGAVAAWTGFMVFGMGTAELIPTPFLLNTGLLVMVVGLVVLVLGALAYRRATEDDRTLS